MKNTKFYVQMISFSENEMNFEFKKLKFASPPTRKCTEKPNSIYSKIQKMQVSKNILRAVSSDSFCVSHATFFFFFLFFFRLFCPFFGGEGANLIDIIAFSKDGDVYTKGNKKEEEERKRI